jgi:cytochrome c biogenesis protein CcmG/thiol:disulfide interchange protein DsbE
VANIFDQKGRTAIDLGVYGAPETFVVDSKGVIQYKHAGPVNWQLANETLIPLIEKLKKEG